MLKEEGFMSRNDLLTNNGTGEMFPPQQPPKFDYSPELTDQSFQNKIIEIIEKAREHAGEPIFVKRLRVVDGFRGGPESNRHMYGVQRTVSAGIIKSSTELSNTGMIELADEHLSLGWDDAKLQNAHGL